MCQFQQFRFPSSDGSSSCYAGAWLPPEEPRGVVQIVHGVGEHIGRYETAARFLTRQGFLVCGEDHLGHGNTVQDGRYGAFAPQNGWKLVVADIARLRRIQGEKHPGVPYFLLGHSMGSFLTRTYLIDHPGTVDGAILSGTGQEPAPLVAFGKLLAGLECRRLGYDGVSPLVDRLSLGAYNRRFRDMMGGLQYIARRENLARMDPDTPVYFFSGDQDPVGGMGKGVRKVYAMFQAAGCRDVTLKLYPGGRHEMFNELDRQQVFDDLLAWLEAHMPREGRA